MLGLLGDVLTSLLDDEPLPKNNEPASAFTLLKYHRADAAKVASGSVPATVIGTEAHVDKGLLTLVVASHQGLQVQQVKPRFGMHGVHNNSKQRMHSSLCGNKTRSVNA